MVAAVFFDFGGVILSSPFDAFEDYERRIGVEPGTIRSINATSPDTNAWARLERGQIGVEEFVDEFEAEARERGVELDGMEVIACLRGRLRPEMVRVLEVCSDNLVTALLTNNFISGNPEWAEGGEFGDLLQYFDAVIESSKAGCRKPERKFYELALERTGMRPEDVVFLDDLGINLKPARAMGMHTIKVVDPLRAIEELEEVTGLVLR